jgi:hypothetical protein
VIHVLVAVSLFSSVLQKMWQNKSVVLCTCFVRYCLILKTCTYHWHHVTTWKCQQNKQLKNTEWKHSMELVVFVGCQGITSLVTLLLSQLWHTGMCAEMKSLCCCQNFHLCGGYGHSVCMALWWSLIEQPTSLHHFCPSLIQLPVICCQLRVFSHVDVWII